MAITSKKTGGRARTGAGPGRRVVVLVATRKGAWLYHADAGRRSWRADGPHFLGQIIHHLVLDPRDGKTLLAAASTGHLGPTLFRSTNLGRSWQEADRPRRSPRHRTGAASSTRFGSRRRIPTSPAPGTPAPRLRGCFAPRTEG